MLAEGHRVQYGDLQEVREILGVSLLDFCWLMGASSITWSFGNPAKARANVNDPVTCLLARFYSLHPDFNALPRLPTPASVFKLVAGPYRELTGQELSWRHFGLLCGATPYSGERWRQGGVPNPKPQRLLLLLSLAVTRNGKAALRAYLKLLDIEAHARGFEGGLADVFKARTWGARAVSRPDRTTRKKRTGPARSVTRARGTPR